MNAATAESTRSPMRHETAAAQPTFADAFAGCGGLSLGLMRAGWRGLFAIERDPFAFETLSTNLLLGNGRFQYDWPDGIEERAWDINSLLSERREALADLRGKVDLLAGGPPCQGFSGAGRRRRDDPRNRLFEAYLELVDILDPPFMLVENVRGFTAELQGVGAGQDHEFRQRIVARAQQQVRAGKRGHQGMRLRRAASAPEVLHGRRQEDGIWPESNRRVLRRVEATSERFPGRAEPAAPADRAGRDQRPRDPPQRHRPIARNHGFRGNRLRLAVDAPTKK